MIFDVEALKKELYFKAIRSSGSGGQHVNKVSSKIEVAYDIQNTLIFNDVQKARLIKKLQSRLTKENILILQCGESRSQHRNKQLIIKRLLIILNTALEIPKTRKPTKVPKAVIKKRLKNKKVQSERKANRKKPDIE